MRLIALLWWHARAWYLEALVRRIAAAAPLHPERLRTERELWEARRRIAHAHRRLA